MARASKKSAKKKTTKKKVAVKKKTATKKKAPAKKVAAAKKKTASVPRQAKPSAPQRSAQLDELSNLTRETNKLLRGLISAFATLARELGALTGQQITQPQPVQTKTKKEPATVVAETQGNGGQASITDFQPQPPGVVITKDQITEALQKVSAEHGLASVKDILGSFNAERISDIEQAQYPAFIEACNKLGGDQVAADTGSVSEPASTSFL